MHKKNNNTLYLCILLGFTVVVTVVVAIALFVYPAVYENDCKTRVYDDLESKLDYNVMNANICIVQCKKTDLGDNTAEYTYSEGSSGVIYEKKDNKYYVLTAYHVIAGLDDVQFIVQPYGSESYEDSKKTSLREISLIDYYNKFPKGNVEYYDKDSDLAIVSFKSDKDLGVLKLSADNLQKGDKIAVISNPQGVRFSKTYGNITSDVIMDFDAVGSSETNKIQCHSAYIAPGSSGSVVLNENMEIAGINIGGGTDFKGRFKYGAMVPCQEMRFFIGESKKFVK